MSSFLCGIENNYFYLFIFLITLLLFYDARPAIARVTRAYFFPVKKCNDSDLAFAQINWGGGTYFTP